MARWGGAASAWTALLALQLGGCSSEDSGGSGGSDDGTTGSGGSAGTGASAVASSSSGIGPGSTTGSGSGGHSTVECDPPAPPGSLYEKVANAFDEVDPVSMCGYRDQVLLIVNTAAL